MSPPRRIIDWYNAGPWKQLPFGTHFHDYYSQPKSKQQAWVYFDDKDAHEIAHLVLAKDADIFDPHWGDEMDDPFSRPPIEEARVFAIQFMVEGWCGEYSHLGVPTKDWEPYKKLVPVNVISMMPSAYDRVEVARIAQRMRKDWSIESIWAEYQRKLSLLC
jgi:hypothetical protein